MHLRPARIKGKSILIQADDGAQNDVNDAEGQREEDIEAGEGEDAKVIPARDRGVVM